jgi:hypothetical protein
MWVNIHPNVMNTIPNELYRLLFIILLSPCFYLKANRVQGYKLEFPISTIVSYNTHKHCKGNITWRRSSQKS